MLKGLVVHGEGVGKNLGYATANVEVGDTCPLNSGIYAARAKLRGADYNAALVILPPPRKSKIEVYLLEYEGADFYGAELVVDPIQKVSEVIGFDEVDELREKIAVDLELVKAVLANFRF